jgi:alpha-L-rhamnosidase
MNQRFPAVILGIAAFAGFPRFSVAAETPLQVDNLRCDYLAAPLGIDVVEPRLSWQIQSSQPDARDLRQTAYQVMVAGTAANLDKSQGDLWDSGRVASDQSTHVVYHGKPLTSRMACYWKVRVWDQNGRASDWSKPSTWTMGLLNPSDWKAQWIGVAPKANPSKADPWFRKDFSISGKPVRATVYVASLGYHELYINGKEADRRPLTPSISDLSQHVRYVTYDVTDYLHDGPNAVVLWCAAGWAGFSEFHVKDKPLVMAQIEVLQPDGELEQVVSDATWKTHPSPLSPLGNWAVPGYGGESNDSRLKTPGLFDVGLDVSRWDPVAVFAPHVRVSAEMVEPNRFLRAIRPVAIEAKGPGVFRIDMGRNYAGWTLINLSRKGKPGQKVTLQFAERPNQIETYGQRYEYILDDSGSTTPSDAGSQLAAWRRRPRKATLPAT